MSTINSDQVAMLLAAISRSLAYGERNSAIELTMLGLRFATAGNAETQDAIWRQISIAAGWTGGFSAEAT